jgi:glycosyltransferase involved in cell wall biosynthesis
MELLPELVLISIGRSGTNYYCSSMGAFEGVHSLFELFNPADAFGLTDDEASLSRFLDFVGDTTIRTHADLIAKRNADPVGFVCLVNRYSRERGYTALSYKLFVDQVSDDAVQALLARPNVRVAFLVRRRIDNHISRTKARITSYLRHDYTDVRPEFDLNDFLKFSARHDEWYLKTKTIVESLGKPCPIMTYEDDIDLPHIDLVDRISSVWAGQGFTLVKHAAPRKPRFTKQDTETRWTERIANGPEIKAALEAEWLLSYAESAPLVSAPQPSRLVGNVVVKNRHAAASSVRPEDLDNLRKHAVASRDPPVTFLGFGPTELDMLHHMAERPALFGRGPGLHFIQMTWSLENTELSQLAAAIKRFESRFRKQKIVLLASSEFETAKLSSQGLRCIAANASIFIDDHAFTISDAPHPALPIVDAIYIARLEQVKRHELAVGLERPLLAYGQFPKERFAANYARVREILPGAIFANHLLNGGEYRRLPADIVIRLFRNARVSLALSAEEGIMRASIQSLLCGLPIVSTPSVGGRDRYYTDDTALIVEPTPEAVASGVRDLIARRLSRESVRRAALAILRADRASFERGANRIAAHYLGPDHPKIRVADVLGWVSRYDKIGNLFRMLEGGGQ